MLIALRLSSNFSFPFIVPPNGIISAKGFKNVLKTFTGPFGGQWNWDMI